VGRDRGPRRDQKKKGNSCYCPLGEKNAERGGGKKKKKKPHNRRENWCPYDASAKKKSRLLEEKSAVREKKGKDQRCGKKKREILAEKGGRTFST